MTRGERAIAFIEKYVRVPDGMHVGKPIKLDDWQKQFILDVLDNPHGTRKAILSVGRKNGKTALIACILLVFLVGTEAKLNTQIASGALSREQAALVFSIAEKMINLSPELRGLVKIIPSSKTLVGLPMNVTYKALSAEGKTAMGGSPILAILDEIGQVTGAQSHFVDAVVTSQGAHENPLMIVISTQAAQDSDLLSIWIDDAIKSQDPHIICRLYTAPDGCDVTDEDCWRLANPALGVFRSEKDMRELSEQASRMPSFANAFRNLYLNQRISTNSPFLSKDSWVACRGEVVPIEDCEMLYAGLDLSTRNDLTSLVIIGKASNGWNIYPYFWTPADTLHDRAKRDRADYDTWVSQGYLEAIAGSNVDYEYVAHRMVDILDGLPINAIAYDRWRIDVFKKELERIGATLPLEEWGQGFKDMSPAIDALENWVLNKKIIHDNNPALNSSVANARITMDAGSNRKLDKMKKSGRIDGIVALAMACGIADRQLGGDAKLDSFIFNPVIL